MKQSFKVKVTGEVKITDHQTGEVIMHQKNAVHPQNCALLIARALSQTDDGTIDLLAFGNGGTFFNSGDQLVYRTPNTVGDAELYNETYSVQVNQHQGGTPTSNSILAVQSPAPAITSQVVVTALLAADEPAGQAVADNITTDPEAQYVFDEIGLKTGDDLLLTHLIFAPIEKTANRAFLITYILTINVS